jgi:hypothetical protein
MIKYCDFLLNKVLRHHTYMLYFFEVHVLGKLRQNLVKIAKVVKLVDVRSFLTIHVSTDCILKRRDINELLKSRKFIHF